MKETFKNPLYTFFYSVSSFFDILGLIKTYYVIGLFKDKPSRKVIFLEKCHFWGFLVEKSVHFIYMFYNFHNFRKLIVTN